jgi:hypothetical protein
MSRHTLSPAQLRASFEHALKYAHTEGIVYQDTGLDLTVTEAIDEVAGAAPDPPAELIAAAEQAFAGQLDGSNAARAEQELRDWFRDQS